MIRQVETWKAFIVENQTHYNQTNESKFNLVSLTPEERGWTEIFQCYPPVSSSGGTGISPINGRSYSWTYGFLPVGYFGANNQSQVFTTDGTWTCPEGVEEVYVRCIGKGGNGGNGSDRKGGSGGGFIMAKIKVVPGTNYAVAVSSTASFGSLMSATAGTDNGGAVGSYTYTESEDIKILFKGKGGKSTGGGGSAGGSELGDGAGATNAGGAGLQGITTNLGGGGMITKNPSSSGAGFKAAAFTGDNGGGMFSNSYGLKYSTSPYFSLLSEGIIEDLGTWGTPGGYGGGTSNTSGSMFSGGTNGGSGGFGGGGANGKIGSFGSNGGGSGSNGGGGGYGGGGGLGGSGGSGSFSKGGRGGAGGRGSAGSGGGQGGGGGSGVGSGGTGGNGGTGGTGGYGGGGGVGGGKGLGSSGDGGIGASGTGGAGLVILEW